MFLQNVTNKPIGVREPLGPGTLSNTNNTMLLRMQNTPLQLYYIIIRVMIFLIQLTQQITPSYIVNLN